MGASLGLASSLRAGAAYMRRVQSADGGFRGLASPRPNDFHHAREHPTVFFTALILNCVHAVPGTVVVQRRAAAWLLAHRSRDWSWNYWVRGPEAAGWRTYPDDLDDTVCALAALWRYDDVIIDGRVQAHLTKQLIATEVEPGGPYTTWLVGRDAPPVWRDVDIAVNANIGFLLALQDVRLPGLERYVAAALMDRKLTSPYYVGTEPVLYFVARWYRGRAKAALRKLVAAHLKECETQGDALKRALIVTAALHIGIPAEQVAPTIRQLLAEQASDGSWPAAALYVEPPVRGKVEYAGSPALTTAFCLEALAMYQHVRRRHLATPKTPAVTLDYIQDCSSDIKQPDLQQRYRERVQRLAEADKDHQIGGIATTLALACQTAIDSDTLLHLNAASIQGWLAYTIYDDFLDDEGDPQLLGVANLALRQTVASFRAALPRDQAFQHLVNLTLECVDGANTWESVHARAAVARGVLRVDKLPDYGRYAQLAERSWGHMLAAVGVLVAAGHPLESSAVRQLQRFFHHFLIARQLCDDAHDWEDDMAHGRLTAVVSRLLQGFGAGHQHIALTKQQTALRQHFWGHTIGEVARLVQEQTDQSRAALGACQALRDTSQLEGWLDRLDQSMQKALAGQQQAQEFIKTYTNQG